MRAAQEADRFFLLADRGLHAAERIRFDGIDACVAVRRQHAREVFSDREKRGNVADRDRGVVIGEEHGELGQREHFFAVERLPVDRRGEFVRVATLLRRPASLAERSREIRPVRERGDAPRYGGRDGDGLFEPPKCIEFIAVERVPPRERTKRIEVQAADIARPARVAEAGDRRIAQFVTRQRLRERGELAYEHTASERSGERRDRARVQEDRALRRQIFGGRGDRAAQNADVEIEIGLEITR